MVSTDLVGGCESVSGSCALQDTLSRASQGVANKQLHDSCLAAKRTSTGPMQKSVVQNKEMDRGGLDVQEPDVQSVRSETFY